VPFASVPAGRILRKRFIPARRRGNLHGLSFTKKSLLVILQFQCAVSAKLLDRSLIVGRGEKLNPPSSATRRRASSRWRGSLAWGYTKSRSSLKRWRRKQRPGQDPPRQHKNLPAPAVLSGNSKTFSVGGAAAKRKSLLDVREDAFDRRWRAGRARDFTGLSSACNSLHFSSQSLKGRTPARSPATN